MIIYLNQSYVSIGESWFYSVYLLVWVVLLGVPSIVFGLLLLIHTKAYRTESITDTTTRGPQFANPPQRSVGSSQREGILFLIFFFIAFGFFKAYDNLKILNFENPGDRYQYDLLFFTIPLWIAIIIFSGLALIHLFAYIKASRQTAAVPDHKPAVDTTNDTELIH